MKSRPLFVWYAREVRLEPEKHFRREGCTGSNGVVIVFRGPGGRDVFRVSAFNDRVDWLDVVVAALEERQIDEFKHG
jgi:hypothetical protein